MATKKDELDPTIETQPDVAVIPVPVYGVDEAPQTAFVYPTAFYIGSNIPYCKLCGEQYLTDLDGFPKCAESRPDCPRTNAHT